jgi:hypothetical protein
MSYCLEASVVAHTNCLPAALPAALRTNYSPAAVTTAGPHKNYSSAVVAWVAPHKNYWLAAAPNAPQTNYRAAASGVLRKNY